MPFPTGLRLVSEEAQTLIPWVSGVNGFFTVIGTVAALILGMAFGFRVVLVIAALCYLSAMAAMLTSPEITVSKEHEKLQVDIATAANS